MLKVKYRNELKHIISKADAIVLRSRLSPIMRTDKHAGPDGRYHIRSLYFDTPEDKALSEKMNGLAFKEKFRVRLYNHNHSFIRLEKKSKHYGKSVKLGTTVTREEVEEILKGNISFLRDSNQVLLRELFLKIRLDRLAPRTVVDYMREAYLFSAGNVRVTIDSDIKSSICSTDLFNASLPSASAIDSGSCILEVKFDGFLPEFIQDIIQLNKCSTTTYSKYAACRIYM